MGISVAAKTQLVTGSRMRGSPTSGRPPEDNGALSAEDAKSPDVRLAAPEKSVLSWTFCKMNCYKRKAAGMRLGGDGVKKKKENKTAEYA